MKQFGFDVAKKSRASRTKIGATPIIYFIIPNGCSKVHFWCGEPNYVSLLKTNMLWTLANFPNIIMSKPELWLLCTQLNNKKIDLSKLIVFAQLRAKGAVE